MGDVHLPCTGASVCDAPVHVHGCYADLGNCDSPEEHRPPPRRVRQMVQDGSRTGWGLPVDELIEQSSLGTPEAKALRERTPPEVVDRIMRKVEDPVIQMKRPVVALGAEVPEDVWTDLRQRWNAVAGHVEELRAERSELVDAATNLLAMKDLLLAHHRSGSPPSEAFWRHYDKAKRRWEQVTKDVSND